MWGSDRLISKCEGSRQKATCNIQGFQSKVGCLQVSTKKWWSLASTGEILHTCKYSISKIITECYMTWCIGRSTSAPPIYSSQCGLERVAVLWYGIFNNSRLVQGKSWGSTNQATVCSALSNAASSLMARSISTWLGCEIFSWLLSHDIQTFSLQLFKSLWHFNFQISNPRSNHRRKVSCLKTLSSHIQVKETITHWAIMNKRYKWYQKSLSCLTTATL
jgi:hypothetical protein